MFGYWYIVFGALVILVASLILWIVSSIKYKKYDDICDGERSFTDVYKKAIDKKYMWNDLGLAGEIGFGVSLAVAFIFTLIAWLAPLSAKYDVAYFKQQSQYVEMAVKNGEPLENIAITHTIIEQNTWLAKANASLEGFGIWSCYCGSGLEELEPISINR